MSKVVTAMKTGVKYIAGGFAGLLLVGLLLTACSDEETTPKVTEEKQEVAKETPKKEEPKKEEPKPEEPKVPTVEAEAFNLVAVYQPNIEDYGVIMGELGQIYNRASYDTAYYANGFEMDSDNKFMEITMIYSILKEQDPQNEEIQAIHDKNLSALNNVLISLEGVNSASMAGDVVAMEKHMTEMTRHNETLIAGIQELSSLAGIF